MAADDNNSGADINTRLNLMKFGQSSGSTGGGGGGNASSDNSWNAKSNDTDELIRQSAASFADKILRFFGINATSIGSTSLFTQFTPPQGLSDKPINQGSASFNIRGGTLGNVLSQIAQAHNLTKGLTAPPIQGTPIMAASMQNTPWSKLGELTPSSVGGTEKGRSVTV